MNVRLSDEAIKLIERGVVWICEHLGSCYEYFVCGREEGKLVWF